MVVCCLAGWAVLIVLTVTGGMNGLVRACTSAWVTCLLIGVEFTIYGGATGHPHDLGTLARWITTPSVWLFYLAVPTSWLALLGGCQAAAQKLPWTLPAVTTASAAAGASLVIYTGIPGLLVTPQPIPAPSPGTPSPARTEPTRPPHKPPRAADPGQELTAAAAQRVIGAAGAALPGTWQTSKPAAPTSAGYVAITPSACTPLAREAFRKSAVCACRPRGAPIPGRALGHPHRGQDPQRAGRLLPAPGAIGVVHRRYAGARCLPRLHRHRIRRASPVRRARRSYARPHRPGLASGLRHHQQDAPRHAHLDRGRAGHNLIFITQQTITAGPQPKPDDSAMHAVLTTAVSALETRR